LSLINETVELLAPAGNSEAFYAAIENGADAIYIGIQGFSARNYASNFSLQQVKNNIDYAHSRNVKVYVALNTLIKKDEFKVALQIAHELYVQGVDALIVQDLGFLLFLKEKIPTFRLHVSTQLTVHNKLGVEYFEDIGIDRIILARELSLEEVKEIRKCTDIELEVFIHGSICLCYSGQCLMSSMIGGRSGNRGYCAQPCRHRYKLINHKNSIPLDGRFLLSPKDLCTANIIPELIKANIDSFKIEGRMKRAEYVAGVVQVYRGLIDRYIENPATFDLLESEILTLKNLYNRTYTNGYLKPKNILINPEKPHSSGSLIGTIVGYNKSRSTIKIKLYSSLRLNDGIYIESKSNNLGFVVNKMSLDGKYVKSANKDSYIEIPVKAGINEGSVYKTSDSLLMKNLNESYQKHKYAIKEPIDLSINAKVNEPLTIEVADLKGTRVIHNSEYIVESAKKSPTTNKQITNILSSIGNTFFEVRKINIDSDFNVFIPIKKLKEIRNLGLKSLIEKKISIHRRESNDIIAEYYSKVRAIENKSVTSQVYIHINISVVLSDLEALKVAVDNNADKVYFDINKCDKNTESILKRVMEICHNSGIKVYIQTPVISKNHELESIHKILELSKKIGFDGVVASNISSFMISKKLKFRTIANYHWNIYNDFTLNYLYQMGVDSAIISPELTLNEIKNLNKPINLELLVDSKLPVIHSERCILQDIFGKDKCGNLCNSKDLKLMDDKGYSFPLKAENNCRMTIFNSKKISMLEYIPLIKETGVTGIIIDARHENALSLGTTLRAYRKLIDNHTNEIKSPVNGKKEYTRGNYFRGVL